MTKQTKKRVADNLYEVLKPSGNRYYVARFMLDGKEIQRSIGRVDEMTLRQAKAKAAQILDAAKHEALNREQKRRIPLFRECVHEVMNDIEAVRRWRNARSVGQWRSSLETTLPLLGNMPIDTITREEILTILRPIWPTKTESARRLQQRLAAVFDWAIVKGFCKYNPAVWKSNLEFSLPSAKKIQTVEHHDAPTIDELHKAVTYCKEHPSPVSGLLLFVIATVCRVSEARQATPDQIDTGKGIWVVPQDAQKVATGDRRVPLSPLAKEALRQAEDHGYLFPGRTGMISLDSARLKLCDILKRQTTVHGIRSTFRDWAAGEGADSRTAELCLSHTVGSKVERAYLRDDLLEKRRVLLDQWAKVVM